MSLAQTYKKEILPKLAKDLSIANVSAVPKITSVVVNARIKNSQRDDAFTDSLKKVLERITGQKPVVTKAKKSIASFKIREGMSVGMRVTLRGKRMYDFIERLIHTALPRVRDFQGIPTKSFDPQGNYTIGFKEHNVFPEIRSDEVERLHGLQVTIVTTARNPREGEALLRAIGFPLTDQQEQQ